jgi:dTDP-4-amino-4,6-dideoxygalactose transaminase
MEKQVDPGIFVPAFPTIGPEMLLQGRRSERHYPLSSPDAHYFFFARNAIWHTAKMLGLDRGEVLVPSYHHGVEIEALMDAGARVRFYRIGERFEVDLRDVERKISPRTTALYLTHFAGFPGPVREMKKLAERHALPLIEDCALSLFSMDGDLPLGITGDVAIFCLYKVLPVPNGGALVFNGPNRCNMAELASPPASTTFSLVSSSLLRNLALRGGKPGRTLRKLALGVGKGTMRASKIVPVLTGSQHFNHDNVNLGISWITKRLLLSQNVLQIAEKRRRNYLFLLDRLRGISAPLFDSLPAGNVPLFYPLLVENNRVTMERLLARGIEAVDFWRDFHPACNAREFPEVAKLRASIVEIPCHQDLTLETMAKIVNAVRDVLKAGCSDQGLTSEPGRVYGKSQQTRRAATHAV